MFMLEPDATPYDLRWRMFGIPVRVHPMFWLVSVILGANLLQDENGILLLAIWIACVFVSILIHELGHVFAGMLFGAHGHIVLYSMGGLAIGSKDQDVRWQRIFVSFAGPLAQFILLVPVLIGQQVVSHGWVAIILGMLFWINLFWPLLNLLPIWPLDGGQISRELTTAIVPANGIRLSLIISLAVSALLAVWALIELITKTRLIPYFSIGTIYMVLFFAMFAFQSWQLLQFTPRETQWQEKEEPTWEKDPDWWKRQ